MLAVDYLFAIVISPDFLNFSFLLSLLTKLTNHKKLTDQKKVNKKT